MSAWQELSTRSVVCPSTIFAPPIWLQGLVTKLSQSAEWLAHSTATGKDIHRPVGCTQQQGLPITGSAPPAVAVSRNCRICAWCHRAYSGWLSHFKTSAWSRLACHSLRGLLAAMAARHCNENCRASQQKRPHEHQPKAGLTESTHGPCKHDIFTSLDTSSLAARKPVATTIESNKSAAVPRRGRPTTTGRPPLTKGT